MRKLFITLGTVSLLGLGVSFAQESSWLGLSFGFPGVSVHYGIDNGLSDGIDLRFNGTFRYAGTALVLGADGIFTFVELDAVPLEIYAGGGPIIAIGNNFEFGAQLFGGGEYRLSQVNFDEGGVFLEFGPTFRLVPTVLGGFAGRLGFNYHF